MKRIFTGFLTVAFLFLSVGAYAENALTDANGVNSLLGDYNGTPTRLKLNSSGYVIASLSSAGSITISDDGWVGLGAAKGRILFDDLTVDLLSIEDATFQVSDSFLQVGASGLDGQLKLYSEQGTTDYSLTLNPNAAMTSAANFYFPVDEPAADSLMTMTTGGVMGFASTSGGVSTIITDEVGTGYMVFSNSPTFDDNIQLGLAGTDGELIIYSEQGANDYTVSLNPNSAMASNAIFYLPADEAAADSFVATGTDGVLDYVTTSAGVAGIVTDETGSGALVFGTSPSFTTSVELADSGLVRMGNSDDAQIQFDGMNLNINTNVLTDTDGQGVYLYAAGGNGTNKAGGNVAISSGAGSGGGANGTVQINVGAVNNMLFSPTAIKIQTLTSNGFVKTSGSDGTLSVDTNTYLTAEADTLATVTGRNASTTNAITTGNMTSGANGADGKLTLYSEQGGTDYSVGLNPNASMASAAEFYLPADEASAEALLTTGTDGIIDYTLLGTGVAAWIAAPSSANLATAITDETGSGALVFGTSPTFTTQITISGAGAGEIDLLEAGSTPTYYTKLVSGDLTGADSTYTLPTALPGSTGFLKSTSGGVMSWDTATYLTTEVDGSVSNEIQNLWETISSQSGTTAANSSTDTLTINGAGIASTAISGDTLTVTATEADTLNAVAGRGATTATALMTGPINYGADGGSLDTYAITLTGFTLATGSTVVFKANTINTGACTLNINAVGDVALKSRHDVDPEDGYIEAGSMVMVVYDGSVFQIMTPDANP